MITAVIVDDEKKSREVLKRLIKELDIEVIILNEASSVKEGFDCINKEEPQLVFLDVEMLDGSGFNLLELFGKIEFQIIFTTAYDKYAIKAFKYSAIDYLLKPINIDELETSIIRAKDLVDQKSYYSSQVKSLLSNVKEDDLNKTIAITGASKIDFIEVNKIVCCKGELNYTNAITDDERTITSSKGLKYFEDVLADEKCFFRVSKSTLINLNYVISYNKNLEKVVLKNGLEVDLSRRRKKEFLELLT